MSLAVPSLREMRAAFARLADRAGSSPDCPSPETIWEAARGLARRRALRRVAFHAIACPACAQAYRLATALSDEALGPGEDPPRARSPWYRDFGGSVWKIVGATAAVVLLAAGIAAVLAPRGPGVPAFRGAPAVQMRSLVPDRALPRGACVLSWSRVEGARYEVLVSAGGIGEVASADGLAVPEFRVPEAALRDLPRGATLTWQVDALLPDGRRVASKRFVSKID